jgi:hypothetical protein
MNNIEDHEFITICLDKDCRSCIEEGGENLCGHYIGDFGKQCMQPKKLHVK